MKTTFNYVTILIAVVALTGVASAQSSGTAGTPTNSVVYAPGVYAGEPYDGFGHYASTVEGGILEGWGGLIRSKGEANYFNSLAAINGQEAYARYVQNQERATETYFRIKQINQAAREANRPQRLSYEQYVSMAKKYAPEGLSEQQYDRTLGRLNWPAVLTGEEFSTERNALNRTFMVRSPVDAGPASAFYSNVRRIADSMDAKLKAKFNDLNSAEYLAAKKFITGLTMESQQPLVVRALAAR
jgi:hypothetical protein